MDGQRCSRPPERHMPSADELARFDRLRNVPSNTVVPPPPRLPDDIKQRFPSMAQWEEEFLYWAQMQLGIVTQGPQ